MASGTPPGITYVMQLVCPFGLDQRPQRYDPPIYHAGWVSVLLCDVCNLASISSSSSSVSPCILCVLLLSRTVRMEPTTRNLFLSVLNCCSFGRGALGNFGLNLWWHVLKHCVKLQWVQHRSCRWLIQSLQWLQWATWIQGYECTCLKFVNPCIIV